MDSDGLSTDPDQDPGCLSYLSQSSKNASDPNPKK